MRRIVSEPLVHFLLLGAVLYGAAQLWSQDDGRYQIVIDQARVDDIANIYAMQFGVAPTAEQLRMLVEAEIRSEVLYREGLALQLDQDDEIVRRRIIQKAEFLLQDLGVAGESSEGELASYFREHAQEYASSERASFTHIYFAADQDGEDGAGTRARIVLTGLQAQPRLRAPELGNHFPDRYDYAAMSPAAVARVFGDSAFTRAVFDSPIGEWVGPFRSGLGWHLIRVTAREAARMPPLEEVREAVRADWEAAERAKANDEAFARLRSKYQIIREDG